MEKKSHFNKVGFVSLGCPKALVDSEQILTRLRVEGYALTPDYETADVVIVNTCGFINSAIEESLDAIGEALEKNGKVIVTGCLGASRELIMEAHPSVLAVTGPQAFQEVMGALHQHLPQPHDPYLDLVPPQGVKLTPKHYAYLKISEGCNHRCSFCIIPAMRGKLQSRAIGEIMQEAENLAAAGVKELLVISQDTSAYGVDVKFRPGFWQGRVVKTHVTDLARSLGELGIWVRLHYVYPYPHVAELIPLMAEGKILPYLDVPFQHASPAVLRAMKRPASMENNLTQITRWRAMCPEITIRSTFIVGFPGETDADFADLLAFLDEAKLDRVGCFMYSPVEGAAANLLPDRIPEEVKAERLQLFMARQEQISAEKLKLKRGSTITVLLDELTEQRAVARSTADAPDIDGVVYIENPVNTKIGDFVKVCVTNSDVHDLFGHAVT